MEELTEQGWVEELERVAVAVAVATTVAMLDAGGFVPAPTMHLWCEALGRQPYAGYVRSCGSPMIGEASAIRGSDARGTEALRPGVP
ncbi:hypothetical protein [Pseudonocardia sp. HH130630-07]|uniref:hypothetical protein n=1 Tax=Pseudonocardia sp. HH130630-07 TaxID=1690815 RepID=UPI0008F51A8D|nr:hypothetical protein [Pseudonocardia sp. HH130630-07]